MTVKYVTMASHHPAFICLQDTEVDGEWGGGGGGGGVGREGLGGFMTQMALMSTYM